MKADLHCHTVLSDGAMDIDQLMHYASRIHLDYIAIADQAEATPDPDFYALFKEDDIRKLTPAGKRKSGASSHSRLTPSLPPWRWERNLVCM